MKRDVRPRHNRNDGDANHNGALDLVRHQISRQYATAEEADPKLGDIVSANQS